MNLRELAQGRFELVAPLRSWRGIDRYAAYDNLLEVERTIRVFDTRQTRMSSTQLVAEAQLLAFLAHPHVLALHDLSREGSLDYLVLEHTSGSLDEQRRPIAADVAVEWTVQILSALDTIHAAGVVHRGLSPGSVWLARGRAKIDGFGSALVPAGWTEPGRGTPPHASPFRAPEQIQDPDAVDATADLYSVGAMAFELLTGRLPTDLWQRTTARAWKGVPRRLWPALARSTRRRPQERFATAREMAAALLTSLGVSSGTRGRMLASFRTHARSKPGAGRPDWPRSPTTTPDLTPSPSARRLACLPSPS